ncbi:MAG TPA: hypothetical protein VF119_06530 [Candidatus Limnocylindrales bacterium]
MPSAVYVVIKPLRPGSHTVRLYGEFGSALAFGVTVNPTVT